MGVLRGVDLSEAELVERGLGNTKDRDPPFLECGATNGAQTSSHNQTDPGIIPRALSRVFEHVQGSSVSSDAGSLADVSVKVKVSLLQIYNETVQVRAYDALDWSSACKDEHLRVFSKCYLC